MKFDLKNINFRPHKKSDIAWRVKWLNDREINKFLSKGHKKITTLAEQEKWFAGYEKNIHKKFFTILHKNDPIGIIGLSKIDKNKNSANLFIIIGEKKFQGKGIGRLGSQFIIDQAFKNLGLKKIDLEVNRNNTTAIKLYESLGFIKNKKLPDSEISMTLKK